MLINEIAIERLLHKYVFLLVANPGFPTDLDERIRLLKCG
jgi:hypothetical protein